MFTCTWLHAHDPAQLGLERFDLLALLADDHAGPRGEDRDRASFAGRSISTRPTDGVRELRP